MNLDFKKRQRSILEKIFIYPSFQLRFWVYTILFFVLIGVPTFLIIPKISTWSNRLAGINIALQGMTLIFGVIATYFALQQLTDSRFSKLDESGLDFLRNKRYFRAINNWREALYIRPDSGTLFNLLEAFLITEQFTEFDELSNFLEENTSFQRAIITEPHDYIIFCYLLTFRNLIVENMGVSKENLRKMTSFIKEIKFQSNIAWEFGDMKISDSYKKLQGDHKTVADNLIRYLTGQLTAEDKEKFETGNYLLV